MVTRRDLLRGMSLAATAVAAPGLLAGCGGSGPKEDVVSGESANLTLVSSDVELAAPDPVAAEAGVTSAHALAAGLYGELAVEPGNLAISPYSVLTALGMTLNGARSDTLEEMLGVCAAESPESLNSGLNAVTQHLEGLAGPVPHRKGDEILLDAANSLFGQLGVTWESAFLDALAASYGAGMHQLDYVSAAAAARVAINQWVAEQTHDRIEDIVPEGALDAMTRLVLVNALYFKAPWADPFEEDSTEDGDFHLGDGSTVRVPMMTGLKSTALAAGEGWTSVDLPYADGTLAMTLVLPDAGRMADVEAIVRDGRLAELVPASDVSRQVELTVPRWTFRTKAALKDPLAALGMLLAFTDGADFSGMTAGEQLLIDDVLHEVFIAVDEAGTEAAAVTAVMMRATSAPVVDDTVVLDRPFLFVIHDLEHGTPLFVGRVADPRA